MRSSKTGCKTSSVASSCVALSAGLLKPNVANILLFKFCEQKFVQHGPITIVIACNGLSLLIFEDKCPNYAFGSKSAPNSDSVWVRWLFNVCVWVFCAPNATILLVYIPAKIKMGFIIASSHTFCKITMIFKVISQYFPALFNRIHNHIRSAED